MVVVVKGIYRIVRIISPWALSLTSSSEQRGGLISPWVLSLTYSSEQRGGLIIRTELIHEYIYRVLYLYKHFELER